MRVDQLLPTYAPHDAISNHARQARKALRAAGLESDIVAEATIGPARRDSLPFSEAGPARPGERALLYHASTDSAMVPWLRERAAAGETVLCDYHNITPSSYFARWLPEAARGMDRARDQLVEMAPSVTHAVADSAFNEEELRRAGYTSTAVSHLLVDLESYHGAPDARLVARRRREGPGTRWLFVGRLAPNKCQHDVLAAFAVYRRTVDPSARLTLVGGGTAPRYLTALHRLAATLELGDSLEMLDTIDFPGLLALYATADVFVCLSEHEGFCVPILEAMELGVPVVAYAAAAVPETVAGAGVLLADKDPLVVALEVEALLGSSSTRDAVVAAGRERAAAFSLPRTSAELVAQVCAHLGAPA